MPNRFCACEAPVPEFGQSSRSLKTAPMPVAVLPMRVLPSVLKLPIWVKTDASDPTVDEPIFV